MLSELYGPDCTTRDDTPRRLLAILGAVVKRSFSKALWNSGNSRYRLVASTCGTYAGATRVCEE